MSDGESMSLSDGELNEARTGLNKFRVHVRIRHDLLDAMANQDHKNIESLIVEAETMMNCCS